MVLARGFTAEAVEAVNKFICTPSGKQHPIILVTTAKLPAKMQFELEPIKTGPLRFKPDLSDIKEKFSLKL
jgi:hypothetical protein